MKEQSFRLENLLSMYCRSFLRNKALHNPIILHKESYVTLSNRGTIRFVKNMNAVFNWHCMAKKMNSWVGNKFTLWNLTSRWIYDRKIPYIGFQGCARIWSFFERG